MSRWRAWLRRVRGADATAAGVRARARAACSPGASGAAGRGRAVLVTGAASGIGRATAQLLAVGLHGTFRTLRAAYAITARRSTSSIVTVASVAALVGLDRLYAYTASKGGVLALSRTMAIEAGRSGVRVNCVCPGAIRTPMIAAHLDRGAEVDNLVDRPGLPEEVAVVVHGLCDPGAGFLTGATVTVDGGATAV